MTLVGNVKDYADQKDDAGIKWKKKNQNKSFGIIEFNCQAEWELWALHQGFSSLEILTFQYIQIYIITANI